METIEIARPEISSDAVEPMKLVELLRGHRVFIQTHNCPDPDAIASAYGLQAFLKHFQIDSIACYDGQIDRMTAVRMLETFDIKLYAYQELEMSPDDYIVLVDSQKLNKNITDFVGNEVACIDHHPVFYECEYQYRDIRITGACASMIAQYFYLTGVEPKATVASALIYGIKMDTADISRGVTQLDLDMLSYLHTFTDWQLVRSMYTNNIEFEDLKAYGAAFRSIEVYQKIGFAAIPFDCPIPLIAIISDFILALDVVEVAIVYALRSDCIRFSVRSENLEVNAGKLIQVAVQGIGDGGGHVTMAGGFIDIGFYKTYQGDIHHLIRERFLKAFENL